jgi:Bacterial Ig-like domain (group 3)/Alpha-L-arabinofuranosidase C-terminal domain
VADVGIEPDGTVTTLTGPAPSATNTKGNPDAVVPRTRTVRGLSSSFDYELPASSVSFIRMHTSDAVAPEISELAVTSTEAGGWYADPATVHVAATDNRSVSRLETSVDGGPWMELPGASGDIQVAGDGMHTVEVRAVDRSGNVGEIRPVTFGIDATAPVTKARLDQSSRTVTLTAADSGAGIERTEYRLDGGAWTTYAAPVTIGPAATTVDFRSTDRLGTTEEAGSLAVPAAGPELAASTTTLTVRPDPVKSNKTAEVTVRVTATVRVAGQVRVEVSQGDQLVATRTVALVDGRGRVALPRLPVGSYRVEATYLGSTSLAPSSAETTLRVIAAGR